MFYHNLQVTFSLPDSKKNSFVDCICGCHIDNAHLSIAKRGIYDVLELLIYNFSWRALMKKISFRNEKLFFINNLKQVNFSAAILEILIL